MDENKAPATDKELLQALDEFLQPEPNTPEEVDAILREAGYDPDQIAAKIKAAAERGLEESPHNWRNKTRELEADKKRFENFVGDTKQTRNELIEAVKAALSNLSIKNPDLAAVHYRNFESATDEDLESLLADLYYLDASQASASNAHNTEE